MQAGDYSSCACNAIPPNYDLQRVSHVELMELLGIASDLDVESDFRYPDMCH